MAAHDGVDLRCKTPRAVIDVIDAVALSKRIDRGEMVNAILLHWAREQIHRSTLVGRVTQGNPLLMETGWQPLD